MFTDKEFDIFEIPGFDARMARLREEITPKLKELGSVIAPRLEEAIGLELRPQVAMHLRRSVNPPEETWVAFSREARGYKPYVHLRVGVNGFGVKFSCYLEEDADDKPVFAANLKANAKALGTYLAQNPQIRSHHAEANYGKMLPGLKLNSKALLDLADRLDKVKSQHANFAISLPRTDSALKSAESLADAAVEGLTLLTPLYRLGAEKRF